MSDNNDPSTADKIRLPWGKFTKAPHDLNFMELLSDGKYKLSDGAKLTWQAIRSFQDDDDDRPCKASYATLARLRNKTSGAIIRQVNQLVRNGFAIRQHRKHQDGDNDTNLVWATIPDELSNVLANYVANSMANKKGVVSRMLEPHLENDTPGSSKNDKGGSSKNDTQNQIPHESDEQETDASLTDANVRETMLADASALSCVEQWKNLIENQASEIKKDFRPYQAYVQERLKTWYADNPAFGREFTENLFWPEELDLCVGDLLAKQKTNVRDLPHGFKTWLITKMKLAWEG
jgi:hypothetical protein